MIKRFPRYAEKKLQILCAAAGALCHEVDEDESGWDALIELPTKSYSGPADTHPPRSSAYVQVKSTQNRHPRCQVKLSNALRAAQSPQPWFIVLVTAKSQNRPVKLYAVHVWEELIKKTLEAVRRAENEGQLLHRRLLTIPFTESDEKRDDQLIQWMQDSIDAVKPEYDLAKRAINQTAGYEQGSGTGLLTITANTEQEILNNFLGLGDGLRVSRFTFTPSRFGIASPKPVIDVSSGTVYITPEPVGDIELRLRSEVSSQPMVLRGKGYGANFPGLPKERKRARFSADFLEILWAPDGDGSECSARVGMSDKLDLVTIENFVTFNEWIDAGPVNIQVWSEGRRVAGGTTRLQNSEVTADWPKMGTAVALLRSIAGPAAQDRMKVSLHDIGDASGLRTFSEVAAAGSLRVEFVEPMPDAPEQFTSILYWYHVDVGEHAFYSLIERSVIEDVLVGGNRRVTANEHRCLEAYAFTNPTESDRKMIVLDFERHLARSKQSGSPLPLADLREFIAASAAPRASEA